MSGTSVNIDDLPLNPPAEEPKEQEAPETPAGETPAQEPPAENPEISALKKQMEDEVAIWAAQDLNSAQSALRIYKIGRYLERVVDRSANISEWIWYQVYGTRMRRGE